MRGNLGLLVLEGAWTEFSVLSQLSPEVEIKSSLVYAYSCDKLYVSLL